MVDSHRLLSPSVSFPLDSSHPSILPSLQTTTTMKLLHTTITTIAAIALLAFAACDASKSSAPAPAKQAAAATTGATSFSLAAANDFVKSYTTYANDLIAATKSKDPLKVASLAPRGRELTSQSENILKQLKGDEARQFRDWFAKATADTAASLTAATK